MDGNGRWASKHGLPRAVGHRNGVEAVRRTVRAAIELGIPYLTLYSFSSENWSRPVDEIDDLMGLMKRFIRRDLAELHQAGVKIRVIGERANVETELMTLIDEAVRADARQPGDHAHHRLQLWRPRRDRQGGPRARRAGCRRHAEAGGHQRRGAERRARHRRHPRSRPARAHQRRDAHLELPAVAVRLHGVRVPRCLSGRTSAASCSRRRSPAIGARERRFGGRSKQSIM